MFDREHLDETVRALVDSQTSARSTSDHEASKRRLAEAEQALTRFQDAIAAGVDPSTLVEAINRAKAQRDTVRADLAHQPKATVIDAAEVYAMIDSFGDVGAVIEQARPDSLAKLYRDLRLEVRYPHAMDGGEAIATIGVANECVRGGTRTPVRRTPAAGRGSCAHRSVRSVRHASPAAHRVKRSFVAGSNSRHSNSRQDSNLRSRLRRPVGLVIADALWSYLGFSSRSVSPATSCGCGSFHETFHAECPEWRSTRLWCSAVPRTPAAASSFRDSDESWERSRPSIRLSHAGRTRRRISSGRCGRARGNSRATVIAGMLWMRCADGRGCGRGPH